VTGVPSSFQVAPHWQHESVGSFAHAAQQGSQPPAVAS
jgi:hypothetical protein